LIFIAPDQSLLHIGRQFFFSGECFSGMAEGLPFSTETPRRASCPERAQSVA